MWRNPKIKAHDVPVDSTDTCVKIDENSIPTSIPPTINVEVQALIEIKSILETLPIKYAQSITPIVMYIDTLLTNK